MPGCIGRKVRVHRLSSCVGVSAALITIAPVLIERGGRLPALSMVCLLAVVFATVVATGSVKRLPMVVLLRRKQAADARRLATTFQHGRCGVVVRDRASASWHCSQTRVHPSHNVRWYGSPPFVER